jgi:hypothetical protein
MVSKITTARSITCAAPVRERNFVAALKSSLIFLKRNQFKTFKPFKSFKTFTGESEPTEVADSTALAVTG